MTTSARHHIYAILIHEFFWGVFTYREQNSFLEKILHILDFTKTISLHDLNWAMYNILRMVSLMLFSHSVWELNILLFIHTWMNESNIYVHVCGKASSPLKRFYRTPVVKFIMFMFFY